MFDEFVSEIKHRQEKYRNKMFVFRKEEQKHQQEPRELKQEMPQQEKPQQQEPQELKKAEPHAPELPAEADLAAGGAAQATFQKGAWTPADPPEAGFAGQGQNTQ